MSQPSVFRKVSLDRLASPEQLDQLMTVTDGRGWIALTALGGLLATAIGWGWLGRIPETVSGLGMLVRSGGVAQVVPATPGRVADVSVAVGDEVHEGQVVARLEQPDLANQVHQAKATLAILSGQHAALVRRGGENVHLQAEYQTAQRLALTQAIDADEVVAAALVDRRATPSRAPVLHRQHGTATGVSAGHVAGSRHGSMRRAMPGNPGRESIAACCMSEPSV